MREKKTPKRKIEETDYEIADDIACEAMPLILKMIQDEGIPETEEQIISLRDKLLPRVDKLIKDLLAKRNLCNCY